MPAASPHSYEEIREVVIDILLGKEQVSHNVNQFGSLVTGVHEVLARRSGQHSTGSQIGINPQDQELIRDVFWDLFRQGIIILGCDYNNPQYPFFRLSYHGKTTLVSGKPWRFHDTSSYVALVRHEVPDISDVAVTYLEEAVAAFYANCLLASCVMIGVAAEAEFLRLIEATVSNPTHGKKFERANKERFIRAKIIKFQPALESIRQALPREAVEDLDSNLSAIQSILRIARNEAGHPSTAAPNREQVYVFLQLFIPFARQLMRIRQAFSATVSHQSSTPAAP